MVYFKQTIDPFKFFKGCLPQMLLPFLNTFQKPKDLLRRPFSLSYYKKASLTHFWTMFPFYTPWFIWFCDVFMGIKWKQSLQDYETIFCTFSSGHVGLNNRSYHSSIGLWYTQIFLMYCKMTWKTFGSSSFFIANTSWV